MTLGKYIDIDMTVFIINFFFGTGDIQNGKAQSLSISISLWDESDLNLALKILLLIGICISPDKILWWSGIIKNYVEQDSFLLKLHSGEKMKSTIIP